MKKYMTEQEIKAFCKLLIEYGKRDFTDQEKEILKQAVDQSGNMQELIAVAMVSLKMGS